MCTLLKVCRVFKCTGKINIFKMEIHEHTLLFYVEGYSTNRNKRVVYVYTHKSV